MASKRKPLRKKTKLVKKKLYGFAMRAQGPVTSPTPPHPREQGKRIKFTQEMADLICERMAVDGHSLREIARDPNMPCAGTILKWAAETPSFAQRYARARERLLEHWAEDTVDIADHTQEGVKVEISQQFGRKETHADMIDHRKLRIEARKWLLSKLAPRKYGDKLDLNVAGQPGAPIKHVVLATTDPLEAAKAYQEIIANT